ncbi:VCBS repeat-containing protein [bacterium]|nr:VCBS repeat-containing protein [bacterium]
MRISDEFHHLSKGFISWNIKKGEEEFCLYFDTLGHGEDSLPSIRPQVGNGSALGFGEYGHFGILGTGMHGEPALVNWTGTGRKDLLVGRASWGHESGVFLYKNLGLGPDGAPRFDRQIHLEEFAGHPYVCDWEGKGKEDLIFVEGNEVYLYKQIGLGRYSKPIKLKIDKGPVSGSITKAQVLDWDNSGNVSLIVDTCDGSEYWPNKQSPWGEEGNPNVGFGKGYDQNAKWLGGAMHGGLYVFKNQGTLEKPDFIFKQRIEADGKPIDVYGNRGSIFVDWTGAGRLDLIVGNFIGEIILFKNTGNGLVKAGPLISKSGEPANTTEIASVTAGDLDKDGIPELIAGTEGYTYWMKRADEDPRVVEIHTLSERDADLYVGCKASVTACDPDKDGDIDLIAGEADGYVSLFINDNGIFRDRIKLKSDGQTIHIRAGLAGSIQGPNERNWGYVNPVPVDWDGDGRMDLLLSDVMGRHLFYRATSDWPEPRLTLAGNLQVDGKDLQTVWRVRPQAIDFDKDGVLEYFTLDEKGVLCWYKKLPSAGHLAIKKIGPLSYEDGEPIKLDGPSGHEGRTKLCVADWEGRGVYDLFFGDHHFGSSPIKWPVYPKAGGRKAAIYRLKNVGTNKAPVFKRPMQIFDAQGTPLLFGDHSVCPCIMDWDGDGKPDLLAGSENGKIYYYHRSWLEDSQPDISISDFETQTEENEKNEGFIETSALKR